MNAIVLDDTSLCKIKVIHYCTKNASINKSAKKISIEIKIYIISYSFSERSFSSDSSISLFSFQCRYGFMFDGFTQNNDDLFQTFLKS